MRSNVENNQLIFDLNCVEIKFKSGRNFNIEQIFLWYDLGIISSCDMWNIFNLLKALQLKDKPSNSWIITNLKQMINVSSVQFCNCRVLYTELAMHGIVIFEIYKKLLEKNVISVMQFLKFIFIEKKFNFLNRVCPVIKIEEINQEEFLSFCDFNNIVYDIEAIKSAFGLEKDSDVDNVMFNLFDNGIITKCKYQKYVENQLG